MILVAAAVPALLASSLLTLWFAVRRTSMRQLVAAGNSNSDPRDAIGLRLAETRGWALSDELRADLWLAAKDPERFLYERALALVGLGLIGLLLGWIIGGVVTTGALFALGVVAGWRLPGFVLASEVTVRRQELLAALSFWAQLIAASVGGSQAVTSAARSNAARGEGWAWDVFRNACNKADTGSATLPDLLREIAGNARLEELSAFAESIEAATERGSVVQETMTNQSEVILRKVHDQQVRAAEERSNVMVIPVGLLFAAFMLFLFFIVLQSLAIAF